MKTFQSRLLFTRKKDMLGYYNIFNIAQIIMYYIRGLRRQDFLILFYYLQDENLCLGYILKDDAVPHTSKWSLKCI